MSMPDSLISFNFLKKFFYIWRIFTCCKYYEIITTHYLCCTVWNNYSLPALNNSYNSFYRKFLFHNFFCLVIFRDFYNQYFSFSLFYSCQNTNVCFFYIIFYFIKRSCSGRNCNINTNPFK